MLNMLINLRIRSIKKIMLDFKEMVKQKLESQSKN